MTQLIKIVKYKPLEKLLIFDSLYYKEYLSGRNQHKTYSSFTWASIFFKITLASYIATSSVVASREDYRNSPASTTSKMAGRCTSHALPVVSYSSWRPEHVRFVERVATKISLFAVANTLYSRPDDGLTKFWLSLLEGGKVVLLWLLVVLGKLTIMPNKRARTSLQSRRYSDLFSTVEMAFSCS
jgi:hypothetical protein